MTGAEFIDLVRHVLGLDGAKLRRIVIDAHFQNVLIVYVEMLGDTRMLEITMPPIEAKIVPVQDGQSQ